jgi:hypothetical protein
MGSSNPQTTTTVNRVEIPAWLEPHMQRIAGDAGALYAEGVGPQYYPGQTWIDFNPYQVEAQRLIGETAVSNDLSPRAFDTAAGIMDYGGVSRAGLDAVTPVHDVASGARRIGTEDHYLNWLSTQNPGVAQSTWGAISPLQNVASGANQITTGEQYQNALNSIVPGGLPTAAQPALGAMSDIIAGNRAVNPNAYAGIFSQAQGGNPFFQQALDDQLERQADQINSQFSGSGRYGSGAHTGVLADRLGEARTRALANQFNQDVQNQLAAAGGLAGVQGQNLAAQQTAANSLFGALTGAQQQAFAQQMQGLAGLTGTQSQNLANQAGAGQYLGNLFQTAQNQRFGQGLAGLREWGNAQASNIQNELNTGLNLGNFYQGAQDDAFRAALAAPALAASRYADWDRLLDLGGQIEARDAAMLKDAIDRFEFQNQMPWNQLGMYGQQLQGVNAGQTQTQIAERPQAPLGQRLLGGAAGGAALGSIFGAPGAVLGGLGGGLLGLWG